MAPWFAWATSAVGQFFVPSKTERVLAPATSMSGTVGTVRLGSTASSNRLVKSDTGWTPSCSTT